MIHEMNYISSVLVRNTLWNWMYRLTHIANGNGERDRNGWQRSQRVCVCMYRKVIKAWKQSIFGWKCHSFGISWWLVSFPICVFACTEFATFACCSCVGCVFFIPALKPPEISSNDLLLIIDYVYVYLPCIWLFRVKNVYEFVLVVNFQRHQFRYLLALSASLRWIASYWSIE